MKIRTRLTLWYSTMLLGSLVLMSGVLYFELVYQRRPAVPANDREPPRVEMTDIVLMYGIPTLTLILGGGWFLMRRTLRPLSELTAAAEAVRADNLSVRLARSGNGDELDRLTSVFNDMLGRLEDSFGRIREFTLHASHELKTPLTIMGAELETALRDGRCTEEQREMLSGHLDEIRRLARIVDDLSLLTKGDAGMNALKREKVRFDELVKECFEDAKVLAEPAAVSVALEACEPVSVLGDAHRLRQLLLNLADNAVKHNERGGWAKIGLQVHGKTAVLALSNTGPAVPPEDQARVFEPFYRAAAARERRRDGTGLGLSIAAWIVRSHDGRIVLRSDTPSVTTVTVSLPRAD